jgi:hypothetical protein
MNFNIPLSMKYYFPLLFATLFAACSSPAKKEKPETKPIFSTEKVIEPKADLNETLSAPIESDCVFDTSTYKFTSETLFRFNRKIRFSWDKNNQQAIVQFPTGDSLLLHIGGCNHFGYSAEYRTNAAAFSDTNYLITKTKWLAKNFLGNGFDTNYLRLISNKQYVLEKDEMDWKTYSVEVDSLIQENEIYTGFGFRQVGKRTHISISGYIN